MKHPRSNRMLPQHVSTDHGAGFASDSEAANGQIHREPDRFRDDGALEWGRKRKAKGKVRIRATWAMTAENGWEVEGSAALKLNSQQVTGSGTPQRW